MTDKRVRNFNRQQMRNSGHVPPGMQKIAPNLLPGVGPQDLTPITCKACGSENFSPVHTLRFSSRFQSVNGQPTMVQFPLGFACAGCGAINPFDPNQVNKALAEDDEKEKAKQDPIPPKPVPIPGPLPRYADVTTDNTRLQDGQKLNNKEDIGVNVSDGIKTGEALK